jgi:hypothetical protein
MSNDKKKKKRGKQPVVKPKAAPPDEIEVLEPSAEVQELLHLVTRAFSGDSIDVEQAQAAVLEVLDKYDIKIHTFLIAMARAKFDRIDRTLRFLDKVESRLFTETRLNNATTFELLQMYRIAQSSMIESLGYVERTLKLREQLDPASAARIFTDAISQSADLAGIELLTPAQRDKARVTLDRLLGSGEKADEE